MMGTHQPVTCHGLLTAGEISDLFLLSLIKFSTIEDSLKDSDVLMKCPQKIRAQAGQFWPVQSLSLSS